MLTTYSPADRAAIVLRLQRGFLGTLLQAVQLRENEEACTEEREERNVEASPALKTACNKLLAAFITRCGSFISAGAFDGPFPALSYVDHHDLTYAFAETIGSDLYMELSGHGVGFKDRKYTNDALFAFLDFCDPANARERKNPLYALTSWVQDVYVSDDALVYP
jgi:hypothetical protein